MSVRVFAVFRMSRQLLRFFVCLFLSWILFLKLHGDFFSPPDRFCKRVISFSSILDLFIV